MKDFIASIETEFKETNQKIISLLEEKNKNLALCKIEELEALFQTLYHIQEFYEFTNLSEKSEHMIKVIRHLETFRETNKLVNDLF